MESPIKYPEKMVFGLPNCGIVAMAICANVDLETATEWFRRKQMPNRNWRGSTHHVYYDAFLREHGVWFNRVDYGKDRIRTIGDFAAWQSEGRLYAIRSAGHMMVCQDGWIADQHRICRLDGSDFWKRNARLKNHWEIIR